MENLRLYAPELCPCLATALPLTEKDKLFTAPQRCQTLSQQKTTQHHCRKAIKILAFHQKLLASPRKGAILEVFEHPQLTYNFQTFHDLQNPELNHFKHELFLLWNTTSLLCTLPDLAVQHYQCLRALHEDNMRSRFCLDRWCQRWHFLLSSPSSYLSFVLLSAQYCFCSLAWNALSSTSRRKSPLHSYGHKSNTLRSDKKDVKSYF